MNERASTGFARAGTVVLSCAAPLLVVLVIWLPLVAHYRVPTARIDSETIERLREAPEDRLLDEFVDSGMILTATAGPEEKVRIAQAILDGRLELPGNPPMELQLPFDPSELSRGSPSLQLQTAALIVPELLIEAYRQTAEEEFFRAAREIIFAWAEYERSAWLPRGYLWNDHACAARIPVLIGFWRLYRVHPSFTAEGAERLLQAVSRSAAMLSKPGHFTYRTNHGVMQNLALWQVAIAFPDLPGAERFQRVAVERLTDQLAFYVNDEGAVLEHSAGYHQLGVSLLGLALRYSAQSGIDPPRAWTERYSRAWLLYTQLRRADGTLPMYGDTLNRFDAGLQIRSGETDGFVASHTISREWRAPEETLLAPAAGIAIWWDGLEAWPAVRTLRQTVVVWGDHPGRAHKHADEMSVLLWGGGQTWWTNAGYWPYGEPNRTIAVSWPGSNAPHGIDEPCCADRNTRLLHELATEELRVVDLSRGGAGGYAARRQVVQPGSDHWIVIDSVDHPAGRGWRTIWTAFPGVTVSGGPPAGPFVLRSPDQAAELHATFLGGDGFSVRRHRGSDRPFAGWAVGDEWIEETEAFVLEIPDGSFAVTVWSLSSGGAGRPAGRPARLERWQGPENWRVVVPVPGGAELDVGREGGLISVSRPGGDEGERRFELGPAPDVSTETARIRRSYAALSSKYETFRDLIGYRQKATILVVLLFLAQELALLVLRRKTRVPTTGLRLAGIACWALVGAWLHYVYLV